jgi:hypothetical protein
MVRKEKQSSSVRAQSRSRSFSRTGKQPLISDDLTDKSQTNVGKAGCRTELHYVKNVGCDSLEALRSSNWDIYRLALPDSFQSSTPLLDNAALSASEKPK